MTFPADQEDLSAVCPYLGLADDADSHATYPTEAHRCYRLENPTRIATGHQETYCLGANHVSCPVYRGEGVAATTRSGPPAGAGAAAAGAAASQTTPERRPARPPREPGGATASPFGGGKARNGETGEGGSPALRARRPSGTLGPRPRSGGISMPVATIGLFALAIVVLALAFLINRAVGGDDDPDLSQADQFQTQQAGGGNTPATQPGGGQQTPAPNNQTPGGNATPAATTPAGNGTPAGGASTYAVQSGDICGTIATDHDLSVDEFLALNPGIDCSNLQIGQEVKVR